MEVCFSLKRLQIMTRTGGQIKRRLVFQLFIRRIRGFNIAQRARKSSENCLYNRLQLITSSVDHIDIDYKNIAWLFQISTQMDDQDDCSDWDHWEEWYDQDDQDDQDDLENWDDQGGWDEWGDQDDQDDCVTRIKYWVDWDHQEEQSDY